MRPDLSSKAVLRAGYTIHKGCWSKAGAANSFNVCCSCSAITSSSLLTIELSDGENGTWMAQMYSGGNSLNVRCHCSAITSSSLLNIELSDGGSGTWMATMYSDGNVRSKVEDKAGKLAGLLLE